jgi:hypothetical protein
MLPCAGYTCGHIPSLVRSVVAPQHKGPLSVDEFLKIDFESSKRAGFAVNQEIALQVLAHHNEGAANWFYNQGFPKSDSDWNNFHFELAEAKVIRYATEAELAGIKLIRYDDMETGQMRPMF